MARCFIGVKNEPLQETAQSRGILVISLACIDRPRLPAYNAIREVRQASGAVFSVVAVMENQKTQSDGNGQSAQGRFALQTEIKKDST